MSKAFYLLALMEATEKVEAGALVVGDLYFPEAGVVCKITSIKDKGIKIRVKSKCADNSKDSRVLDKKQLVKRKSR